MAENEPGTAPRRDHFSSLVRQWSHFGPPLRPSPDDTAVVQRVISGLAPGPRAAVLGLTPEIIGCAWPRGTALSAVDHSPAMVRALWSPDQAPPGSHAILADWCAMPIRSGTLDLVVGDGCYIVLPYPEGYFALNREVRRVLRPSGRYVIRVFLRPDRPESIADIARAVGRGEVGSVHALKLRLLAALHGATGVRLDDVWRAWTTLPALPPALAGSRGWTGDELTGIEGYRGLDARYFLPTLAEFRAMLAADFVERECAYGGHELGDRCPTLVLTPKSAT
jgi:SAM-dependent methyltransferase